MSRKKETVRYKVDPSTGCWLWQLSLNPTMGHGNCWCPRTKQMRGAHLVMWESINGPLPEGLELDHKCRVPSCVNPDHLEPVPHVINVRRGSVAKLTEEQVMEIRRLKETTGLSNRQIGAQFGVTKDCVSKIMCGKSWVGVHAQT